MASYTSGAPDKRTKLVDKGRYDIVILNAEEKTASSGNTMIKLKCEVTGRHGEEPFEPETGPIVYDNLVFCAAAAWKIDQFRLACGDEVVEGEEVEVIADELMGSELTVDLIVGQNDKGQDRNEIDTYVAIVEDDPF